MQTPQGFRIDADGRFMPTDWCAIIFNPSFFYRLPHMVLAAYLSVAFFVGAVGAWHLLRDRGNVRRRARCSRWRCGWRPSSRPLQIVMGDQHGLNTLRYQPVKVAAMEGDWDTVRAAPR